MSQYQVIVGNIGAVYDGPSKHEGLKTYHEYVDKSRCQRGRAAGEAVTLMEDGNPYMEHQGRMHLYEDYSESEITTMLSHRRVEDPKDRCPNCDGTPFEYNNGFIRVSYDDGRDCRYKKTMKCGKCGLIWNDILRIVGIELIPEENKDNG